MPDTSAAPYSLIERISGVNITTKLRSLNQLLHQLTAWVVFPAMELAVVEIRIPLKKLRGSTAKGVPSGPSSIMADPYCYTSLQSKGHKHESD